ncbi:MAG: MogA/MoaB family molybdenum cofactor biosynthesis protein [Candidatus Bathyarchaeota archaeon]|nr:MogA/MoaB family molybdenum cofactor biosynthesis protein [Candidatus Bathyarchaeota archaeon]
MSESSRQHKTEAPKQLGFRVVTCSTSRFTRQKKGRKIEDTSGDLIVHKLIEHNHRVVKRVLVSDETEMIMKALEEALEDENVSAIIFCGGTGIAAKDITIETVTPMLTKILPGFGELFRQLSYESIGSAAILSRALAGIAGGKAVFCIPGSIDAARLCLDKLILPEAGHIVKHSREMP